ncbi:MAG: calcium/sodium antiporter [Pseudomonadota bacterium]
MDYFLVAAGLTLLVLSGDGLVRGAVSLSQRLGVPPLAIGLTVVAFGTSAPELVVGIDGVVAGVPTLTLGNVVGSNTANILLVIGVPALIQPIRFATPGLTRNVLYMLGASMLVIALGATGAIAYWHGFILVTLLGVFIVESFYRARRDPRLAAETLSDFDALPLRPYDWPVTLLLVVGGLAGLILGAHWLIDGSVAIARRLGVPEAFIGLTLVAIGTSLPELATALIAAFKGHADVAVGNVVGSNIFNLMGILGLSSLFGRIPVTPQFLAFDFWVMLAASLVLLPLALRRGVLGRLGGLAFIVIYVSYIAWLAHGVPAIGGNLHGV